MIQFAKCIAMFRFWQQLAFEQQFILIATPRSFQENADTTSENEIELMNFRHTLGQTNADVEKSWFPSENDLQLTGFPHTCKCLQEGTIQRHLQMGPIRVEGLDVSQDDSKSFVSALSSNPSEILFLC